MKNEELDAMVAECERCKSALAAHPSMLGAADGDAVPQPKAVDPATVLAIIDVVLKLIAAWRSRK